VSAFPQLLHGAAALSACAGLLYAGVLALLALVSVLAPSAERRKDARTTLTILVRRRSR
jgi:hypothetical protein